MREQSNVIDLRSDTVTQPSAEMRDAMASAPVGDDQFGEDPSINELQDYVAELLEKEAALWLPTGTMANQVSLRTLTRPGDDVIVSRECHAVWHETGASAANAGVHMTEIGRHGVFTADEFVEAVKPRGHIIYPPTTVVQVENTHNRAGGVVFPFDSAAKICTAAQEREITTYLDGARLWNAAIATARSVAELAKPFDLVSVALSKGLGAPGGSVLAGRRDTINRCIRYRRMLGGAMRQVGVFAAAGLFALKKNLLRLEEDHRNTKRIAETLHRSSRVILDLSTVQTNILVFGLSPDGPDAPTVVERARDKGVLIFAFGTRTVRAVTHLDVSESECDRAANILLGIIEAS